MHPNHLIAVLLDGGGHVGFVQEGLSREKEAPKMLQRNALSVSDSMGATATVATTWRPVHAH